MYHHTQLIIVVLVPCHRGINTILDLVLPLFLTSSIILGKTHVLGPLFSYLEKYLYKMISRLPS